MTGSAGSSWLGSGEDLNTSSVHPRTYLAISILLFQADKLDSVRVGTCRTIWFTELLSISAALFPDDEDPDDEDEVIAVKVELLILDLLVVRLDRNSINVAISSRGKL